MIHALFSGVITFFIAVAIGEPIVKYLRRQKIGKEISEYLPEHAHKAGTPTFGGFIIWLPTFLVTAVAVDWWDHQSILLPLGMIGITMAAGFVDDLGTLQHRAQKGLSWRFKMGFTAVFGLANPPQQSSSTSQLLALPVPLVLQPSSTQKPRSFR